jgi:nucleoporin NDC1
MWAQVYKICMDTVKSVETRIDNYNKPPAPAPAPPPATVDPKQRVSAPLREDPILNAKSKSNSARGGVEKAVGHIARSPGSSPVSKLSPIAKKTWNEAKDRLLSREQQKALSQSELVGKFEQNAAALMSLGIMRKMFERSFRTEFAGAALGTPLAEPAMYVNAIVALTQLAVHSLAEDQFGNVHRDVPSILRNLTALVRKLESFRAKFPVHWTDTRGARESPEADAVLDAARAGLLEVVESFEPYTADLRLSLTDIRLAKEAAAKPQ